jgi:hypothetical protein
MPFPYPTPAKVGDGERKAVAGGEGFLPKDEVNHARIGTLANTDFRCECLPRIGEVRLAFHAIGSTWRKWDLHFHTPSSFDYQNKAV